MIVDLTYGPGERPYPSLGPRSISLPLRCSQRPSVIDPTTTTAKMMTTQIQST